MANQHCTSTLSKLLAFCRLGIFIGLVGQSFPAMGQSWTNGAADNNFLNVGNWSLAPNFNSNASVLNVNLDGVNKAILDSGVSLIRSLDIDSGAGNVGEIQVDSGSLTVDRSIELGNSAGTGKGTMTVNGGVVSTTRGLIIGQTANAGSVFNLTGGAVTLQTSGANLIGLRVGHADGGNGSLNISGGTMTVQNNRGRFADSTNALLPSTASLTISGTGSLVFANDLVRFGGDPTATAANTASVSISDSGLLSSTISNVQFAQAANSQVTVNLSGNGTIYAKNSFTFGRGLGSTTTVTMTGGLIDGDRIDCGAAAGAAVTFNVSGGTISATSRPASTAGLTRGSLYLGEGAPQFNLSGTAQISAERLLINDGASLINLTDDALVHIKGSTRELSPGVLESDAATFSFTEQFFSGLWAEALGKVRLNEVGVVLRVEGESETIANPVLGDPDLAVNYLALFNAAITNGVITTTLGPEFTLQASYDGVHTKVEVVSVASAPEYVGGHPYHDSFPLADKVDTSVSLIQRSASPQTAELTNIISSSQGINGVVLDFDELADLNDITLEYKMSPQNVFATPVASWSDVPAAPTATLLPNAGQAGSDRVQLTWGNGTIMNRYLCIRVIYNGNTIAELYLGHLKGEMTGGNGTVFSVSYAADLQPIRVAVGTAPGATGRADIDKNNQVQLADIVAMRTNAAAQLTQVTIPASP